MNVKLGVSVFTLVTTHPVNVGGTRSIMMNVVQLCPYDKNGTPGQDTHLSGSSQISFVVIIVGFPSDKQIAHWMMLSVPLQVQLSASVHRSRYSTLHVIPSAQTLPPTGGRIHWAS